MGGVFLQLASGRFIPNCFIRLRNVLGGIPKRAAAPSVPLASGQGEGLQDVPASEFAEIRRWQDSE